MARGLLVGYPGREYVLAGPKDRGIITPLSSCQRSNRYCQGQELSKQLRHHHGIGDFLRRTEGNSALPACHRASAIPAVAAATHAIH